MNDTEMSSDTLLAALASPARRKVLEMLSERPRTAGELHEAIPIAGPAVSRHLRVLREAGLVSDEVAPGDRRVRLYSLQGERLDALDSWLRELKSHWQMQLQAFKRHVENSEED